MRSINRRNWRLAHGAYRNGASDVHELQRSMAEAEQAVDETRRRVAESLEVIKRFDNVKRREQ